ncbi:uncharacterized protein J8A68_005313 [[Candida] subhashii]|uniref:Nitrogen regulatory protein areA GATA-like domain-containing protein n=1 Tax=[Candida] subhashii TaxID=561895 RepID=A0A8J5UVP6_9ASCO|nr:uncharacterized protein J8A68_005313 [[Candida] subhashii]KAG7661174.1 hypothetical protein J8A68_005313 [[Candida] subhashii]
MYYYDDMVVGPSSQQIPTFRENIDYLEYVPNTNTKHYLHDNINLIKFMKYINNNPDYKLHNAFLYQRLSNICWRRFSKNFHQLSEINPYVINWDKNSDITWLFGPKIASEEQEQQQPEQPKQTTSIYSCQEEEDNMSVSSLVSESSINSTFNDDDEFSASSRKNSTISSSSSYYDEDEEDDYNWNLKSILKKGHKEEEEDEDYLCISDLKHHQQRKKVSFNYIVNTREIINGISVDYDFLDHDCL